MLLPSPEMEARTFSSAPEVILVGLPLGDEGGGLVILLGDGLDLVFLVVVLHLAVRDFGRAVVQDRQPWRRWGLAFALCSGRDGGSQGVPPEYVLMVSWMPMPRPVTLSLETRPV